MSQSPRTRARELVLESLYACEHGDKTPDQAFEELAAEEELTDKNVEFARALFKLVVSDEKSVDEDIAGLAENWNLNRMAAIDRIILRMAIVELVRIPHTPVKVVLNEAIELAKKFSTIESSKFVNGILDNFVKQKMSES